jgi:uncharacterized protein (DUF1800 family)
MLIHMDTFSTQTGAMQALIRFGLGRRGAEPLSADPHAWLAGQLDGPDPALRLPAPDTAAGLTALRLDSRMPVMQGEKMRRVVVGSAARDAVMTTLLSTDTPFRERLVWFWANHFSISYRQGSVGVISAAYVREAIRPHVTGRFVEMLRAVMHHPAMLMYLGNNGSVGPDSPVGRRRHAGLNENLARESLELHTVTPASGYSQADVTAYSAILTGWSVALNRDPPGFLFRPRAHEPGAKTVMGRVWPPGKEGGERFLTWLGTHPATMHNLAVKLCRHFVADTPPPEAVRKVETVLRDTGGDLRSAAMAVLALPQAWVPLTKLRTPFDYVVATLRAFDLPADAKLNPAGWMAQLGQPFLGAELPNGWADTAASWAAPAMIMRRIDWATAIAGRARAHDPTVLARNTLGPLLPPDSQQRIARAGSRKEAIAMLIASPQFQRR